MYAKQNWTLIFAGLAMTVFSLLLTAPLKAHAQENPLLPSNGTCLNCHEDLYYLHDTGKYFCLNEMPMSCTDCHGGNAQAMKKEEAHTLRSAHPIINDDISKCSECHPDQCAERAAIFETQAGTELVSIAQPFTPQPQSSEYFPVTGSIHTSDYLLYQKAVAVILIAAIIASLYFTVRK